jgi:hypothetical protein
MLNIKKLLIFAGIFSANWGVVFAQSDFVYSLPKTVLKIDVTVTKTTEKTGQFYQYAGRYLAADKIVTEEKTHYEIKSVNVMPLTQHNPKQTYNFSAFYKKNPNLRISVDEQGILTGLNNPIEEYEGTDGYSPPVIELQEFPPKSTLLPLTEEYMLAGSTAKLAEGAAKQIYRIREGRLALLLGETEHVPSGEAMKSALKRLDELEKQLTELFTGTISASTKTKTFYFEPEQISENQVLFRLSSVNGLVQPDDLSGTPYYIHANIENQADNGNIISQSQNLRNQEKTTDLHYILSANGKITIDDGKNTLFSGDYVFPQFGKPMVLGEEMLTKDTKKVVISNQTGRLTSIMSE